MILGAEKFKAFLDVNCMESNFEMVFGATKCINLDVLTLFNAKTPNVALKKRGTVVSPASFNLILFLFKGHDFKTLPCI